MTIYYLIRCFKRPSQGQQQVGPAMTLDGQPVYQVAYGGQAKQSELVVMQQSGGQQMYAPQGSMAPMYAPQQQQQQQQQAKSHRSATDRSQHSQRPTEQQGVL